jgi:hypothetical protein
MILILMGAVGYSLLNFHFALLVTDVEYFWIHFVQILCDDKVVNNKNSHLEVPPEQTTTNE